VPPPIPKKWGKNPIDAFIFAKMTAAGLTPSTPAPRRQLLRRLYLDLIGLLPTPEEVQAFEADRTPNAYEKRVDQLLASPRYGERWGRHWLDLARYADSGGFEGDKDRIHAWRYRDYVIDSFNQDTPYNRFLQEQIAGDELFPNNREALIATGFLGCGPQDIVEMNARTRSNELDDLVSTTGSAILGLTVGCARCHDHKYDPVTMTDYYRLSSVFAPTVRKEVPIPTPQERQEIEAHNAPLDQKILPLTQQAEPFMAQGRAACIKSGNANPTPEQILQALPESDRKQVQPILQNIQNLRQQRREFSQTQIVTDSGREFGKTFLLLRGDAYHLGKEVTPGFIASLPEGAQEITLPDPKAQTTGRRKALAEWITTPKNPLTARVWVNRVWRQHFGRGIVNTPSNFGINGELPSHPELLEWLAAQFMAPQHPKNPYTCGWSTKRLHRLILLSETYQQASELHPLSARIDPQNRLYSRMAKRRLEGEAIRDSLLQVAGTLNLQMGGSPVYPPIDPSLRSDTFQGPNWHEANDDPTTWRRSVYVKVKRSLLLPHLEVFDCPEITYTVAARNTTTTPLQALLLLNDPLILKQAQHFAQRLKKEAPQGTMAQIERGFWLTLGRAPTFREKTLSLNFFDRRGATALVDFCQALFNLNEFVYAP
jgi:hypothetical protein